MRRAVVIPGPLLFFSAVALSCMQKSGQQCEGENQCASHVTAATIVSMPGSDLATATVKACRRAAQATSDFCSVGTTVNVPTGAEQITLVLAGQISATAIVSLASATSFRLDVAFSLDGQNIQDGDEYSVEVSRADNTVVRSVARAVRYDTVEPNGPGCLPNCKVARFEEL